MAEKKEMNFEANISQLEEIVRSLEEGNMSLEDSIRAYEEGMKLCAVCNETLKGCQQRIARINMATGEATEFEQE